MFDLSFSEVVLVVLVAAVFIGPKELPVVIRAISKAMRAMRGLMHEVRGMVDELAKESGIADDIKSFKDDVKMIQGEDGQWYESYDVTTSLRASRNNPAMDRHGAETPRDDENKHD